MDFKRQKIWEGNQVLEEPWRQHAGLIKRSLDGKSPGKLADGFGTLRDGDRQLQCVGCPRTWEKKEEAFGVPFPPALYSCLDVGMPGSASYQNEEGGERRQRIQVPANANRLVISNIFQCPNMGDFHGYLVESENFGSVFWISNQPFLECLPWACYHAGHRNVAWFGMHDQWVRFFKKAK